MSDIDLAEIILILGVAVVFLGPRKLREFAALAVRAYRDFRQYKDDVMRQVQQELWYSRPQVGNPGLATTLATALLVATMAGALLLAGLVEG